MTINRHVCGVAVGADYFGYPMQSGIPHAIRRGGKFFTKKAVVNDAITLLQLAK